MIKFTLNGESVAYQGDPSKPLLWYVREDAELLGSKFGCGVAMCGACTMHLNGQPVRACVTPLSQVSGGTVTTIEGLTSKVAEAVQQTWQRQDVVQCGYCQSGQIMSAVALLESNAKPSDEEIDNAMTGNLCRCGTYHRIRKAIHSAAEQLSSEVQS